MTWTVELAGLIAIIGIVGYIIGVIHQYIRNKRYMASVVTEDVIAKTQNHISQCYLKMAVLEAKCVDLLVIHRNRLSVLKQVPNTSYVQAQIAMLETSITDIETTMTFVGIDLPEDTK